MSARIEVSCGDSEGDPLHLLEPGAAVTDPLAPYEQVDRSPGPGACWVMAHMVGGLDGSAAIGGRVSELSTTADAQLFLLMRALADVVLVGAQTVRQEKYGAVTVKAPQQAGRRSRGQRETPALAVVSRSLDLDWSARAFTDPPPDNRTLIITCESADAERLGRARDVAHVVIAGHDQVEPTEAMSRLAARGHRVVLCEGGPSWLGQLVAADLLDELCLTVSPLMGGDLLPVSISPAGGPLRHFGLRLVMREDDTLFLRYGRRSAHGG